MFLMFTHAFVARYDLLAVLLVCLAAVLLPIVHQPFGCWSMFEPHPSPQADRSRRSLVGWAGLLLERPQVRLRQVGGALVSLRAIAAAWCLQVAARISPNEIEVLEPRTAPLAFDVEVERHGAELRLSIGDRAVRLARIEAEHLSGLLSSRWAGVVRGAQAETSRQVG